MKRIRISFGRSALAATGIVGCLTLAGAGRAHADGWSPGLTIGTRFDRPVPGVTGDTVIPGVSVKGVGVMNGSCHVGAG